MAMVCTSLSCGSLTSVSPPRPPRCDDQTTNGGESDTDCGGATCPRCRNGKACAAPGDCQSGVCTSGICAEVPLPTPASCSDQVQNGQETDIDCGGHCAPCAESRRCGTHNDCSTGVCWNGACRNPECNDSLKNGSESDVDCGGSCGGCNNGHACTSPADCLSRVCAAGVCQDPTCSDRQKNGTEGGTDCGGTCATKCDDGVSCASGGDCKSNTCVANVCAAATCVDGSKNGAETDTDCGGGCARCADYFRCAAASDCVSGVCTGEVCRPPTTLDKVKNGTETDIDCGGASGARCDVNRACTSSNDCWSRSCVSGSCQPTLESVGTGWMTTCGFRSGSGIKCWGNGITGDGFAVSYGAQPGEINESSPWVALGSGATPRAVFAGDWSACAILWDGSLKCWGFNWYGRLGVGSTVLRFGSTAATSGANLPSVNVGSGRTVKQVAMGLDSTCAILDNDRVKCWGNNSTGTLGYGDFAVRGDELSDMGDNLPYIDLGTNRTAVRVVVGDHFSCAILENHAVKCWGANQQGQLGLDDTSVRGDDLSEMGDSLPQVDLGTGRTAVQLAAGSRHVCALLDNGWLKCWGANSLGQLGLGDTNARGDSSGEMGDNLPAVKLGTGLTVSAISANGDASCALLANGAVKCWGMNGNGELGVGDQQSRGLTTAQMGDNLPTVNLGSGRTALVVSVGRFHACAVLDNDRLKCWGQNQAGELGIGLAANTFRGRFPEDMGDNLPFVRF